MQWERRARTRLVGVCAFSGSFPGFKFFSAPRQNPSPPTCGYRLLHLSSAEINPSLLQLFPVVPDPKQNLPIEIWLSRQILSLFKMITFFFRERFAIPVSP
jgi:hypothetical protein